MDGFPELLGPARLAIKYRVDTVRPSKTSAGRRRRWECMDSADASTNWLSPQKFSAVQDILDQNKILINEINSNHESRTPEALARNVVLIRELNSNLLKVVELYRDLSDSVEQGIEASDSAVAPAATQA